ncbi:MOSC domain-containing protein [Pelagimonas varians]|uniref:Metal-sulfur cluster biosynthesis proteins YuaD n=1 Tax=Pelagimonas varians TaxID=696760 RepID=A0A238KQZ1_9RHOB|nr:MOSC domain-containing protein [Pelagimonas varians]PYG28535.1 MOSC domain-containing protein [Pelagimonas varians]SMX45080.1 Putative metal-sulfur cluster biosynthesis proteins YuaD [Pelagimonas varians]
MPALKQTDFFATITWLGTVPLGDGLRAVPAQDMTLDWDGPLGEKHGGRTRPSCSRVTSQHTRGTDIANVRQLSVVSQEELDAIARDMGLGGLEPEWLGATLVIQGIADFSFVPPSSRLQAENGTTLIIDMNNRPCIYPAKEIESDKPGFGPKFKSAANGRRGVTAWVERPGVLAMGDRMRLHIPDQRQWAPDAQ